MSLRNQPQNYFHHALNEDATATTPAYVDSVHFESVRLRS